MPLLVTICGLLISNPVNLYNIFIIEDNCIENVEPSCQINGFISPTHCLKYFFKSFKNSISLLLNSQVFIAASG